MLRAREATSWGPRALALAAALGPFWPTTLGVPQLFVGRVLLVVVAVGVALDLLALRGRPPRPAWAAAGLVAALGTLAAWTLLNGAAWGCFCSGTAQGFTELVVLVALAAVVGLYASARALALVVACAAGGALLGGVLAAVGLKDLHAAVYAPTRSVGRLDGVYGNANFLAYPLALALPGVAVGVLRLRGRLRILAGGAALALAVLLLATYSRGSLLAAGVGVPVALGLARPRTGAARRRRPVAIALVLGVPVLIAAVIASPLYRSQRLEADFGRDRVTGASAQDISGWNTTPRVGVPVAGARIANVDGDDLRVAAARANQGVGFDVGPAFGRSTVVWSFTLRADGAPGTPVRWQVLDTADRPVAAGRHRLTARAAPVRARFAAARGAGYRLAVWAERPARFVLDDVSLFERRPGAVGAARPLPTRLLGTVPEAIRQAEGQYVESRFTGVELALRAFAEQPLRGIGLDRFPAYAATHARYGSLPTHNAYAQILAELGLVGLLPFLVAAGLVLVALVRGRAHPALRAALAGTVAAGAGNLVFINGLASPGAAMPLALAVGLAAALAGPRPRRAPAADGPVSDPGVGADVVPGPEPSTDGHPDPEPDPDGEPDADPDGEPDADPDGEPDADRDADPAADGPSVSGPAEAPPADPRRED
ncbi:O-antigen ligase family protein [Patulibacter sp. SYSU D01012]|uniref:O-antigen ligase family protein n=1 Tax=Patulibacter sp. SYSU D01012 TaxID=2817381 RepID=UPI001B302A1E|nr:O-antigen ligase family protein [Patulibacter sp. SYSU D01012]